MTDSLGIYTLGENHKAVPCSSMKEWGLFREDRSKQRVALDQGKLFTVSTVFLGIDYGWGKGEPILFETVVFGRSWEEKAVERYSTWEEAVEGHQRLKKIWLGE